MKQPEKPLVIGIVGGSGSGKTRFVRQLVDQVPEKATCLLCQDNYYLPREQQARDPEGVRNFDLPSSFAREEMFRDLNFLLQGQAIERTEYVYNNAQAKSKRIRLDPAPIILVEGLFVFHFEEVNAMLDLRVFVHAKENLKVIRRIKRDREERNYPLEDVLYRYEKHVHPTFEQFIKPYMEESDLVVNNNESFDRGLQVMAGFIRDYLFG
jgi:uridine kinase